MKRLACVLLGGALLMTGLAGCGNGGSGSGETVTVEAVSAIAAQGGLGLADSYAGKVVAGETAEVKRDSTKTILETYVKVGDMVKAGDVLFAYDTEAMQLDLDGLYLEKENMENTISSAQNAISDLEDQRDRADSGDKLEYTLQIDSKKADIREAEYNKALKERDIAALEEALLNAEITSPIAGRVMEVDETGGASQGYDYGYGSGDTGGEGDTGMKYITVTDVTRLRVEGNINELNASALTEGMPMRIRSRTDGDRTWSGTLSSIDWENPVKNQSSSMFSYSEEGDDMTTASKYPFYVELTDTDGLLLGQHVYIEPDMGDGEQEPAGPVIPSYYIAYEDDGGAYVWADNGKDKLEKRSVTLGQYMEAQDAYEVAEGLDITDYIAFPAEGMESGQPTEKYAAPEAESGGDSGPAEVVAVGG